MLAKLDFLLHSLADIQQTHHAQYCKLVLFRTMSWRDLIQWLMHKDYQVMLAKVDLFVLTLADIHPTPHGHEFESLARHDWNLIH